MARKRTGRRSQRRLGTQYPSTARRIRFVLTPTSARWQSGLSRLIAALLLALLGWAGYAIFVSSNFYVYGAEVQGNTVVTPEEVYAVSELEGVSAFWVDPAAVASRVETLPNVRAAQVKVRLPARVIITVEERTPEFIWQTGENRWWVDADGVIVPPRAELAEVLTIIDTQAEIVSPGQALDPTIIEAAESLRRLLPELLVLNYSRATGISFTTREGWPIYLGDGQDMDAKLTILVNLRQDLLARGVSPQFIDVRFVDKPFYR